MVTIKSFKYAAKGLRYVLNSERNARIHMGSAIIALAASIILKISLEQWLFVVISIAMVFFAEIVNTAVEKTLDLISQENNQLVKLIKDMTAAGVLVCAMASVIVAIVVFIPRIVVIFQNWF